MDNLAGKIAVVTGAASGIGLALARRCAADGMHVVLADVDETALERAADDVRAEGTKVVAVITDVADASSVEALRAAALDVFPTVHLVLNNAGVGGLGGPAWQLTLDEWRWTLDVNLWGVIHGIQVFVPLLVEQGEGHVVNVASGAGLGALPGMAAYVASKFAVVGLSETLQHDLAAAGSAVGVSVVCPMFVRTRIHESHRLAPPSVRPRPDQEGGLAIMAALVESGMDPDDVAAQTLDAVRAGRFYVLTHPEVLDMLPARTDAIVAGGPAYNPLA